VTPTLAWAEGSLTFRAPVLASPGFARVLMVLYMFALVGTAAGAVYATRRRERTLRRTLQLQAWQLRQLVV